MYFRTFRQFAKILRQIDIWLDKATGYADSRSFDPNVFVDMRLAPDQFPLARQIQIACDTAKLGASRLTGKTAPTHADDERTIADLRARIASVVEYLDGLTEDDFAGVEARTVTQPRWEGRIMTGPDYFMEHVVPNFYFHAAHAYAILRHNGVPLGKRDYLGPLTQRLP